MATLTRCLVLATLVALARGCAVPHGGCRQEVCSTYSGVSAETVDFPGANYDDPATWSQGSLPLIGYWMGKYNKLVNSGSYNRAGIKDTPALNFERFDLQKDITDPRTGKAYAQPSSETTIEACCKKCAEATDCYVFQFFPADTPSTFNDGVACWLLSGGTSTWDWAERGTPFAGSFRKQTNGARTTIPKSFAGGRCNGSAGFIADPHFTGAHGTRFDFNGEIDKSFCLATDQSLHINGVLKGYREDRTEGATIEADGKALRAWVRELGILWRDAAGARHTLHLVARSGPLQERGSGFISSASVDGTPFVVPGVQGQQHALPGEGTIVFNGLSRIGRVEVEHYRARMGTLVDLSLSVRPAHPHMQAKGEAEVHFNLLINELQMSPRIHGVLGQTYRSTQGQIARAAKFIQLTQLLNGPIQADGKSGEGFLDGRTADYITSSVTSPDCKFSAFA